MSVQLAFGNSLAPIKLLHAPLDLHIDSVTIVRQPTVLFLLGLQQAEQYFLDTAGACRLNLLLDSSFQSRIADFNVHCQSSWPQIATEIRITRREHLRNTGPGE